MNSTKHFIKQYHNILIPSLFLLGLILPFNGFWLSGLFYFGLSWLGFGGFLGSFELKHLLHSYALIGFAVPVFTLLTIVFYALYQLIEEKLIKNIAKTLSVLSICSYISYIYLTIISIIQNDFSFSFFNQSLWFLSSLLCFFSLFKWSNRDTITSGELPCNTLNIQGQSI